MKSLVMIGICLLSIYFLRYTPANQECPNLNGRYRIHPVVEYGITFMAPVFVDASRLLKLNLIGATYGEVEIRGNASEGLSFFWETERDGVMPVSMPTSANSEWKFHKDYQCENGAIIFSRRSPANRNNLPGAYEGDAQIRLAREDSDSGLMIESTFSGHEVVSLFSYDSAHIDFPKWWSRKTMRETIILDAVARNVASGDPLLQVTKPESQAVAHVRQVFNDKLLGGLILAGAEDHEAGVTVTLKALRSSDIKPFEDRLRAAAIPYQMKTVPIWADNSYYMELLIKAKP